MNQFIVLNEDMKKWTQSRVQHWVNRAASHEAAANDCDLTNPVEREFRSGMLHLRDTALAHALQYEAELRDGGYWVNENLEPIERPS